MVESCLLFFFFKFISEPDPFICLWTERPDQGSLDSLPVLPEFQRATKWTTVDQKVQLWRCNMLMSFSTTIWTRQYFPAKWDTAVSNFFFFRFTFIHCGCLMDKNAKSQNPFISPLGPVSVPPQKSSS